MENAEGTLEAKRFSVKRLAQDPKVFKFYTGFAGEHFYCVSIGFSGQWNEQSGSLGAFNSNSEGLSGSKPGPSRKLTAEDKLLV